MYNGIVKKVVNHTVFKNSLALMILQFSNVIAPILVLPYLTRILGIEGFGLVMIALSISSFFVVITDFGFNLSATHLISENIGNVKYINNLISVIYIIKITIISLLLIATLFISNFFEVFNSLDFYYIFYIFLNVSMLTLLPTWLFQAIEKMKYITIYVSLSKIIYLILILFFINNGNDGANVVLFLALSNSIGLLVSFYLMYSFGYRVILPVSFYENLSIAKYSSKFFISRFAVTIYTTLSTFIVGNGAGVQQAAIYGASEKLYQASQTITGTISQALFPHMVKNKESQLLFYVTLILGTVMAFAFTVIWSFADVIVTFIFGDSFSDSIPVFKCFLIISFVNLISVNYGYPAFSTINRIQFANYTTYVGAVIQIIALSFLYVKDNISALNVTYSILLTEVSVMLLRVFFYYKFKRKYVS